MITVCLNGEAVAAGNIFCIGRNYVAHIEELKNEMPSEMVVFGKPTGSLAGNGSIIKLPPFSSDVHFECELLLLVGKNTDGLTAEDDWRDYISGYGVGLDLTARDIQSRLKDKGLPWFKAKGFKQSACVSDFIPSAELPNPDDCEFTLYINGALRQHGQTGLMIHPLGKMVAELAETYGLQRGDIIFTGTPQGVGKLSAGDRLVLALEDKIRAEFTVA
ncbi:fumarylacetoacetate hydrolase family protein [Neisseria animalis]|uniref:FAA hydrolase family protein n=1 Tax=Neisseria animalis TaxID=492 RepID=A0A5P3MTJ9_NEIAN|nr:fumarylacetoacetate hydrolase family protein [Neisseria animalis]QEY24894.1 FAA hydrolase family protein [Neisseria animalis]ROW32528.1 FAA hydrolase family protein [Neisseria animalis]VEE08282.1 putative hydrolase [Neisseria animalis]